MDPAFCSYSWPLLANRYQMNLYVSNLAYSVNDDDLRVAFEAFGAITSARVVMDRDTGRSRGFGFVEMPNDAEANAAISGLSDSDLGGRPIKVVEARPKEPRPAGGGGFRPGGGGGGGGGFRPGGGGGGGGGGRSGGWKSDRGNDRGNDRGGDRDRGRQKRGGGGNSGGFDDDGW